MRALIPILGLIFGQTGIHNGAICSPNLVERVVIPGLEATCRLLSKAQLISLLLAKVGAVRQFEKSSVQPWVLDKFQIKGQDIIRITASTLQPFLGSN